MMSRQKTEFSLDQYLGCFGRFRKIDPVCRTRCALNLRCAIAHYQNERFEILEELVSAGGMAIKGH
jgi:hypothetical protein